MRTLLQLYGGKTRGDILMKYVSLFSGIGGFEVGIQRVFPDAECVGYSELYACTRRTFRPHWATCVT
jgi:site-specific DNA-cytosine methylase